MGLRPLVVFGAASATLSSALGIRMLFARSPTVLDASCLVASWIPFAAAVMLRYGIAVADRTHGLASAWVARVLGMQFVLAWAVSFADLLRELSGAGDRFNRDLAGPVVIFGFAPVFIVAYSVVRWIERRVRSEPRAVGTESPREEMEVGRVPFRGMRVRVPHVARTTEAWVYLRAATLPLFAVATLVVMRVQRVPSLPFVAIAIVVAGLVVRSGHARIQHALGPLAALTFVALLDIAQRHHATARHVLLSWPWVLAAALVGFLLVARSRRAVTQ